MTPDLLQTLNTVDERGSEWLGEMLELLDREGRRYHRACAEIALTCAPSRPGPARPTGMPQQWAQAIREHALDETTAIRLYGGRR